MPELPEVEVVKRSLTNKAQNSIVKAIKINDRKLRYKIDKNKIRKIIGLKIEKISRRSKFLLFYFNKKVVMLVHLGMTGKFFFLKIILQYHPCQKQHQLILNFAPGSSSR